MVSSRKRDAIDVIYFENFNDLYYEFALSITSGFFSSRLMVYSSHYSRKVDFRRTVFVKWPSDSLHGILY